MNRLHRHLISAALTTVLAFGVTVATYRYFLDDELYTHAGDNRGYGAQHDLARANIFAAMEGYGLSVQLEPFVYNSQTYYNVVGTKVGTVHPEQEYIVGAHFDSVNNPGADDNASGVALVLEAARILTQYDSDYTIRFIAFDREEQGLIGSDAYVERHMADDIIGMISTDMVAYNTNQDDARIYGRSASAPIKNALADAITTYGDGLVYSMQGGLDASDHAPFEWAGLQACLLIEGEVWSNPFYHTQRDNVDEPNYIDYEFAARMTRSVVGFLVDHAEVQVVEGDTLTPDSFDVMYGEFVMGDVFDLTDSDDAYVRVEARRPHELAAPSVQIEVVSTAFEPTATRLTFTLEASTSGAPARQKILLFDYDAGAWEMVDDRVAPTSDETVQVRITENAGRFVDPATSEVKARVGFHDYGVPFLAWDGQFDLVRWNVVP
jgi:hypothetical protein